MPVVDFMILGFMKSGTTTLNDYLSLNDDVLMCKPKEPQFFSRNYDKGIGYYESLWEDESKICGEASTCYSRWPFYKNVPEKILLYNPKMKFVFIMREPVERAYSHFRHNVLTDGLGYKTFSDALSKSDEILMTSMYMTQIERFLEFFPKEQFLLLNFDDLAQEPLATINKLEVFIGVKKSNTLQLNDIKSNQAGVARAHLDFRVWLDKIKSLPIIRRTMNMFFSEQQRNKIRQKVNSGLEGSKLLKKYGRFKASRLQLITENEKAELRASVLEDIKRLEFFWGKDLSSWKGKKKYQD